MTLGALLAGATFVGEPGFGAGALGVRAPTRAQPLNMLSSHAIAAARRIPLRSSRMPRPYSA